MCVIILLAHGFKHKKMFSTVCVCVCRLKERCPRWRSAGCRWSLPAAPQSSSLWAERITQGRSTLTYPSSSWSHLDWYMLRYSPVRHTLCAHMHTCTASGQKRHSSLLNTEADTQFNVVWFICHFKKNPQSCKVNTSKVFTVVRYWMKW